MTFPYKITNKSGALEYIEFLDQMKANF